MNRAVSRFLALRRVVQQPKRSGSGGGHHEVVNPGPPCTMDYSAVPFQPYQQVYNELNAKFNIYLGVSSALLAVSIGLALYNDVFVIDALGPPKSYKNRRNQ